MGESCKEVREFCRSNGQNEYSPRKLKFSRGGGGGGVKLELEIAQKLFSLAEKKKPKVPCLLQQKMIGMHEI